MYVRVVQAGDIINSLRTKVSCQLPSYEDIIVGLANKYLRMKIIDENNALLLRVRVQYVVPSYVLSYESTKVLSYIIKLCIKTTS